MADDIERVGAFRDRLVAYTDAVIERLMRIGSAFGGGEPTPDMKPEQTWLGQEYGRLYRVINQYGKAGMRIPAIGVVTQDVVMDAIHRTDSPRYSSMVALAVQQLDTVIGRLQADAELPPPEPVKTGRDIYTLTSPVYWAHRVAASTRRLLSTHRGRIVASVLAVAALVATAVISGVAQGFVDGLFFKTP